MSQSAGLLERWVNDLNILLNPEGVAPVGRNRVAVDLASIR
jgi:hypothetical protein